MGAPVVRWQILSPEPDAVAAFYGAVFGWTVHRQNALGAREIDTQAEGGLPGGLWPAPAGAPTFVQLFVQVDDVDAAIAAVVAHGGSVLVPRAALPEGEVMAILRDPFGASFGVMSPAVARPSA
jgi:predicted enzyme related to lactoylglutathione lyase